VLELLEPDGSLSFFASTNLLAATMYPDQKEKREELLVTTAVQLIIKATEEQKRLAAKKGKRKKKGAEDKSVVTSSLPIPVDWLSVLLRSPSAEKVLTDASTYAGYSWAAGELILFMISAAIHHPALDVTLTKAVWALSRIFAGEETYGGGSVSVSQRTVWKAWSRFKSVAHFHAIRQIWLQDKNRRTGPDIEGFVDLHNDRMLEYISLAEAVRKAAVERRILRHDETWWPPERLELPPARVQVPPLPPTALEELAKYAPEHSRDADLD
jgi:hypothetical protein